MNALTVLAMSDLKADLEAARDEAEKWRAFAAFNAGAAYAWATSTATTKRHRASFFADLNRQNEESWKRITGEDAAVAS